MKITILLHWRPITFYSIDMILREKSGSSTAKLNWTYGKHKLDVNCALWWIVNYSELWNEDRQFSRTVYVISWTVIHCFVYKKKGKFVNLEYVFVSFQDFVGKTRNFSVWIAWPDSAEKRDMLNTGSLDISGIWYWKSVHWWIVYHQWKQIIRLFEQWNIHGWEE